MQPPTLSPRTSRPGGARVVALALVSVLWQGCSGADITTPPTTGQIKVTTSTSGTEPDSDGYSVSLDTLGGVPIAANGSVLLTADPGDHTVELAGVSPNCGVDGGVRQSVPVTAGDTAAVGFAVTCTATAGGLRVRVSTTGDLPDDSYLLTLDQGAPQPVAANAELTLTALALGDHVLALSDIAQNCSVTGANPRSATVTAGDLVEVSFEVSCSAAGVQQWTMMDSQTRADLPDVWGSSGNDVFVVGEEDTETDVFSVIQHYDGTGWTRQFRKAGLVLRAVWGSSSTDVLAVGADQDSPAPRVLHFDGSQWTEVGGFGPGEFEVLGFESVWGSSATDIFVVGSAFDGIFDQSLIFHYDGTSWRRMQVPGRILPSLVDVWGSSPTDVYAVGQNDEDAPSRGVILHFDGTTWTPVLQRQGFAPTSIWGSSAADVFVAGFQVEDNGGDFRVFGTIFHYDGADWSRVTLPPGVGVLHEIWGSSAGDVFSVGDDGIVVHFDGTQWTSTKPTGKGLLGVWGFSPGDVFAVGEAGTILHGTP
jgi:hypothetical protein